MKSVSDRVKEALLALVKSALPTIDYYALYRARVVTQAGGMVDVLPDDPRLPGMSAVPLKLGLPGATVSVAPGAYVLVGWEGGDPQRPHALVWESDATVLSIRLQATSVELQASMIRLGDSPATLVPVLDGVLNGKSVDPFTGLPHAMLGNSSPTVLAKVK